MNTHRNILLCSLLMQSRERPRNYCRPLVLCWVQDRHHITHSVCSCVCVAVCVAAHSLRAGGCRWLPCWRCVFSVRTWLRLKRKTKKTWQLQIEWPSAERPLPNSPLCTNSQVPATSMRLIFFIKICELSWKTNGIMKNALTQTIKG